MKNRLLLILLLLFTTPMFAWKAPGTGGQSPKAPIDTYEIILVAAAVLLIVGAIVYKKLSIKKIA